MKKIGYNHNYIGTTTYKNSDFELQLKTVRKYKKVEGVTEKHN